MNIEICNYTKKLSKNLVLENINLSLSGGKIYGFVGKNGSGTVFFSGCNLGCVYCQNREISSEHKGFEITSDRLAEIFLELQDKGANNINLVTPTHYVPHIIKALDAVKGLDIPIVYNCGGYESVDTLKMLDGYIDIYLPDFKYADSVLAKKYSKAEDYPIHAKRAIDEMVRQAGGCEFDENGMMKRGIIVRHLVLPSYTDNSKRVIKYLYNTYGDDIYMSIMKQYRPPAQKHFRHRFQPQSQALRHIRFP